MVQPAHDTRTALSALVCFKLFRETFVILKIASVFRYYHLCLAYNYSRPIRINQISFPAAKASRFWVFMLLNLGRCRARVGFIQTRCYIVPWRHPPKQLRRWETELYCVGTTQLYVHKKKKTSARRRSVNFPQSPQT